MVPRLASTAQAPRAVLAALAIVVVATALASYLPARRAAAIEPMTTLKAE